MHIEQIWTGNAGRNFNYFAVCETTGEAVAIDPLDHEKCLACARDKGWRITHIVNTHEHGDHTGGNGPMMAAAGAPLLAHKDSAARIAGVDRGLDGGDTIEVGQETIDVLYTPGHTMMHVSLLTRDAAPALLCGDTLFNAGVGNCHNGGHPEVLYETYRDAIASLPDDTRVYPGHDYIANNLRFTLDREPDNARATELLREVTDQDPNAALVTTLGLEKEMNTFLRLDSPSVHAALRDRFPDLPASELDERAVFLKLRELRNDW